MKPPRCLRLLAAFVLAVPLSAQTALLHPSKLPPQAAAAVKDLARIEPIVGVWPPQGSAAVRAQVAAALRRDRKTIQAAAAQAPRNEEVALAAGIAATFAYNLDMPHAYRAAVTDLRDAAHLSPADPRPPWLLGGFFCGTGTGSAQGMAILLKVGSRFPSLRLPPAFWRSYAECATFADMPEHVLYAEANLNREHAVLSAGDRMVLRRARALTRRALPSRDYAPNKVWRVERTAAGIFYSSDACGLALPGGDQWKWQFYALHDDICAVAAVLGPYRGRTTEVTSHLLILVRPQRPGESLDQFARTYVGHLPLAAAATPPVCPVARCLSYVSSLPAFAKPEGGEYALITAFAWRAPQYPGLAFESPQSLPQHTSPKLQYFTQAPELGRMAPTLDGFVLLDTAASVRSQALAAERTFFAGLRLDAAAEASSGRAAAAPPPGSQRR